MASVPWSGVGHSAPILSLRQDHAVVGAALLMGNVNSVPLDWAARRAVGGTNLSVYIIKQLPVLPPDAYREDAVPGGTDVEEAVVTRVLELTYTADDVVGFARSLGYDGPPFRWNDDARHRLRSELDAVYAHLYGLDRSELEWILDAEPPGVSFPTLKANEMKAFGEYRTRRYVLTAFDQLAAGEPPCLRGAV